MKSLWTAAAIIVVANAFALVHAARNRWGTPDAEIELTSRELSYINRAVADDDSGVRLNLQWTDLSNVQWLGRSEETATRIDQQKLRTLGFTFNVEAASPDAQRYYQRQRARRAFVALEYNGEAWRTWADQYDRAVAKESAQNHYGTLTNSSSACSRLLPIDVDLDFVRLRARHLDRTTVVIVPAVIGVRLDLFPYPGTKLEPGHPARVTGRIEQIPYWIHVPRPFSEQLRPLTPFMGGKLRKEGAYSVQVRFGRFLEPWVTRVEVNSSP